ncbi:MAG TPA: TonB-dependent siderophore receptor [Herbaspirillum sp.]
MVKSYNPARLRRLPCATAVTLAILAMPATLYAQQATPQDDPAAPAGNAQETTLESIQVSGDWLGSGLENSVKRYPGARTVVKKQQIEQTGAINIGDVMRRIPGVQTSENSGTSGSPVSLNIGVRGLTGRYSPRSIVLLDGIPMSFAPYGQPQLSFAPISLNNIESIDVVRGGGAVRYGPQNVGGIINFKTRSIPAQSGISGDATLRQNEYGNGGSSTQYSTFLGTQLESGLGLALLYSGSAGRGWRDGSDQSVNDLALKFRYELTPGSEFFGKISHYDVKAFTPGGLTAAQYAADPFQNTRKRDYWDGTRQGFDFGYLNTISDTQEFEIRTFYNKSYRHSMLINTTGTSFVHSPRNYQTYGIEPRYTQRIGFGPTTNDITIGYRFIRERGDDGDYNENAVTGAQDAIVAQQNATNAQAVYLDDKIAIGAWRITPGIRYERIRSTRFEVNTASTYSSSNNKALPSINVAYLLTPDLTLFGNYNTSFGPVQNTQLNSQSAANPLLPEVAKTTEAGARWKSNRVSAEVTAFNIKFDNQILAVPSSNPLVFQNIGATKHDGIETAIDYSFDKDGAWAGLNVFANYTYTRAIQKSGATAGRDVPFYSRNTDTIGAHYSTGPWGFDLSSTHQSKQFADLANTVAESANAATGVVPAFRTWNTQVSWRVPGAKGFDVLAGVNNLTDKRYYTRNAGGDVGRLVGAPRTVYVQGRLSF